MTDVSLLDLDRLWCAGRVELDALDLIIEPWLTILDFKLYLVEIAGAFDTLRLKSERYDTAVLESEIERSEVIIAAADCLDDELGDGKEALERDSEILGAEHAVTAGGEQGGQRVIVRLIILIELFVIFKKR